MEDAQQRKERLRALRAAAATTGADDEQPAAAAAAQQQEQQQPEETVLKFRNYTVKDKKIEHQTIEAAHAPEFVEPVAEPSVVQEVQGQVTPLFVRLASQWEGGHARRMPLGITHPSVTSM
jgi:hypothetical protein